MHTVSTEEKFQKSRLVFIPSGWSIIHYLCDSKTKVRVTSIIAIPAFADITQSDI